MKPNVTEKYASVLYDIMNQEERDFLSFLGGVALDTIAELDALEVHITKFTQLDPQQNSPIFDTLLNEVLKVHSKRGDIGKLVADISTQAVLRATKARLDKLTDRLGKELMEMKYDR